VRDGAQHVAGGWVEDPDREVGDVTRERAQHVGHLGQADGLDEEEDVPTRGGAAALLTHVAAECADHGELILELQHIHTRALERARKLGVHAATGGRPEDAQDRAGGGRTTAVGPRLSFLAPSIHLRIL
jgi:hypothetical protein